MGSSASTVARTPVVRSPSHTPCQQAHALASAPAAPCNASTRKWVLIATILGSSLAFMDGTVVNVALPALQGAFSASVNQVQWVIEAYQLLTASLLLVCGSLGDHYGRRRAFAAGILLFVAASVWCGFAPTIAQLILARALQGIGGALLIPTSLSLLASSYPSQERGTAIGTWSAWSSLVSAAGPVAGGWLIQHATWRLIFFLNVPIGLAVLLLLRLVPESKSQTGSAHDSSPTPLDWPGAALITASLGSLTLALLDGPGLGWLSMRVLLGLTSGLVLLAVFLVVEARSTDAMMPLGLFRSRSFSAANLLTLLLYAALGGALFFIPFYLIQVRHYSATGAGSAFLPLIAIMFLFSRFTGGLVSRFGARLPLVLGPALAGAGFMLLGTLDGLKGYAQSLLPGIVVLGIGMTVSVAPLTTVVMNSVPEQETGVASGVNNAISRVAGLLAIALLGIVLQASFSNELHTALAKSQLSPAQRQSVSVQRSRLHEIQLPTDASDQNRAELSGILDGAFLHAFRRVMESAAVLCWIGSITVALMMGGLKKRKQPSTLQAD